MTTMSKTEEVRTEKSEFTAPVNVAAAADKWFSTRTKRLAKQKEVDALEREESFLKDHIIQVLPASKAEGISGKLVTVMIEKKDRAEVSDFDAFTDFIVKNKKKGAFSLLNRAVNAKTVKEYWAAGVEVPGLKKVTYKTLAYSAKKT